MRRLILPASLILVAAIVIASCGTARGRTSCNTKHKTRVDMGWM